MTYNVFGGTLNPAQSNPNLNPANPKWHFSTFAQKSLLLQTRTRSEYKLMMQNFKDVTHSLS